MPERLALGLLLALGGCASSQPLASGSVAFGVLGDTPYSEREIRRLDGLIGEMNAEELAFVVHVGDIGGSAASCTDAWLEARKRQFERIRHRFILVPGDNEWSDCASLGLDPLERLAHWRRIFCFRMEKGFFERQQGGYCEHLRWEAAGWVFATLNVPGSDNNAGHPEHEPRMKAVFSWLDEAAALAEKRSGLVVFMQANPFSNPWHHGYDALRARLAALGKRLPGRVLLVHGDTHLLHDDEPLPGLRRIEVWGSPFVAWTRLRITDSSIAR